MIIIYFAEQEIREDQLVEKRAMEQAHKEAEKQLSKEQERVKRLEEEERNLKEEQERLEREEAEKEARMKKLQKVSCFNIIFVFFPEILCLKLFNY
jgi:colicin import membrane protein